MVARIWASLKNDASMLEQDEQIREYFLKNKNANYNMIENDMELLDL